MLYMTKPIKKEAAQFFSDQAWPSGVYRDPGENSPYYVVTIHGQKTIVVEGDFIVPEPDGEHYYPCKPDIFLARHVPLTKKNQDLLNLFSVALENDEVARNLLYLVREYS